MVICLLIATATDGRRRAGAGGQNCDSALLTAEATIGTRPLMYRRSVAHLCTECGYEYPEAEFQATTPDQRRCPDCGSTRISASVCAVAAVAVVSVSTPSILMTTHLWPTWMRIAIDRARAARDARTGAARDGLNNETAEWMRIEFEASVVAVAASAHALDALYGSTVIPPAVRAQWVAKGTRRHGKIREALKQASLPAR